MRAAREAGPRAGPRRRHLLRQVLELLPLLAVLPAARAEEASAEAASTTTAPAAPAAYSGPYPTIGTWNYADQALWGTIPETQCATAGTQSPIDFLTSQAVRVDADELQPHEYGKQLGPIVWGDKNAMVKVSVDGLQYTWTVALDAEFSKNTKTLVRTQSMSEDYHLRSFSFHSPSEHTRDGKHYDMEVQFLHTTDGPSKDPTLITSVMMEVGGASSFLGQFWSSFPTTETGLQAKPLDDLILHPYDYFYPEDRSFYSYNGSRTVPQCEAPALWLLFEKPVELSQAQLDQFRWAMYGANNPAGNPQLLFESGSPAGVTENVSGSGKDMWNAQLGMNIRKTQELGSRKVRYVEHKMPPQVSSALPEGKGAAVLWGAAAVFFCCGSLLVVGVAMRHAGHFPRLARALGVEEEEPEGYGPYGHFHNGQFGTGHLQTGHLHSGHFHGGRGLDHEAQHSEDEPGMCGCLDYEETRELEFAHDPHGYGTGPMGMGMGPPVSMAAMSDPYQAHPLMGPVPAMSANAMEMHAYPPPPGYTY